MPAIYWIDSAGMRIKVTRVKQAELIQFGTPEMAYYGDILIRAHPRLHEEAIEILQRVATKGSRIIDMGSGQGAFAARMRDHGYNVTAIDKNPEDFRASDVDFVEVDFDNAAHVDAFLAAHAASFDVVVGMEVIEHVENPWAYVRMLLTLAKPDGIVLLTTPNAGSIYSRMEFLLTGLFTHFSRGDYETSGHINPLIMHELGLIAENVPARVLEFGTICRLPWIIVSRRIGTVLGTLFASLVRPFLGKEASGDIIYLVLQKQDG